MSEQRDKIKLAVLNMLQFEKWNQSLALTLTLKQSIVQNGMRIRGDDIRYVNNYRHLLNVVSKSLYRHKASNDVRLNRCFSVLEKGERYHIHAQIEVPKGVSAEYLEVLIRNTWPNTAWGYNQMTINVAYDFNWFTYMLKDRTKPDGLLSSVDFLNYRNQESSPARLLSKRARVRSMRGLFRARLLGIR